MPDPWQQDYRLNKDELITYRYSVVLVEVQSGVCSDRQKIPVLPRGLDECGLKENRTYLVAGGIRGYGFEVARWMAENGAKSIGLIGRSKPSDAEYQEVRGIETKTGAKFHIFQVICSIFVTVNFHLMQHFYDYISLIRNAVYIHVL